MLEDRNKIRSPFYLSKESELDASFTAENTGAVSHFNILLNDYILELNIISQIPEKLLLHSHTFFHCILAFSWHTTSILRENTWPIVISTSIIAFPSHFSAPRYQLEFPSFIRDQPILSLNALLTQCTGFHTFLRFTLAWFKFRLLIPHHLYQIRLRHPFWFQY